MQLKKLEMCGFKSFAHRTEIVFNSTRRPSHHRERLVDAVRRACDRLAGSWRLTFDERVELLAPPDTHGPR